MTHPFTLNPRLSRLNPYPFERLARLLADLRQPEAFIDQPVNLSIGEPKHPTPAVITEALVANMKGLSSYPATAGSEALRSAIGQWLTRRYGLKDLDPLRHVLPVLGSREALFSLAQVVINRESRALAGQAPIVLAPNPFYQIYEGAAILAGAQIRYLNQLEDHQFAVQWDQIEVEWLKRTQLLYVCSPGNPTGRVMDLQEWRKVFALADQYGFVIASDECYSEIWHETPPLGALQAAQQLGRSWERLISFTSLSKRSNAPGMRSGFVAGDPELLKQFLLYRTYHGSAMSLQVQAASAAAWSDEAHVEENRRAYRAKYEMTHPLLNAVTPVQRPEAGFYYWLKVPPASGKDRDEWTPGHVSACTDDEVFVRKLKSRYNVLALPGSYLSRDTAVDGRILNPGAGYVRLALVEPLNACTAGIERIAALIQSHRPVEIS